MAPDDNLLAALGEIRGRVAARDALVKRMGTAPVGILEFNAAQDRLAGDVPRLLAALEFLLSAHAACVTREEHDRITAILNGEEKTDG